MKFLIQSLVNGIASIGRNKLINFLCLGIIAFSLLVLGIFNYIAFNLDRYSSKLTESIEAIFYLKEKADPASIQALVRRLQANLLVKEVGYTSRQEAEMKFSQDFPELNYVMTEFPESPFPASVEVTFKKDAEVNTQVVAFIEDVKKHPLVESVQLNLDWARKIAAAKKFISLFGYFLGFILIFVTVFIIFNVIKLNIFFRREEIAIFRLVGATDWYIKTPFLFEGSVLGLVGGILADLLLLVLVRFIPAAVGNVFSFVGQMFDVRQIPWRILAELVITGGVIGLFSSLFSLKRYVR